VGVVSQRLLPRKDGRGRVVAAEVMVVTGTIQDAILDGDKLHEIYDLIADGKEQYGSQTFDQNLRDLVEADLVSYEVATAAANTPADFELKMRTLV
jgi:twitching motility protein PilT